MEWLQGVVQWAQAHADLALFGAFLIALLECTVLIGLLTPGLAVMFAVGALVSLGALPLGLTLAIVALGGLIGDAISYELGRRYGEALFRRPFFAERQGLLHKGARFFARHGGKGLIAAHIIGPLRPVMPAIAGAYGLRRLRFWLAIVPAAAIWAAAYVLPGVVFGASLGLAAEVTRRLAIVLVVLAGSLWLALWLTRRLVLLARRNAEAWLHTLMDWSQRHGRFGRIGAALADPRQPEVPALLGLALFVLLLGTGLLALIWNWGGKPPGTDVDAYESLRLLREPWGVRLAGAVLQLGNPQSYGGFALAAGALLAWRRNWNAALHLVASVLFGLVISLGLWAIPWPLTPDEAARLNLHQDLALAICIYGFVPALLGSADETGAQRRQAYLSATVALLLLLMLAQLYLGGMWLSVALTVTAIGLLWVAGLGLSFRRHGAQPVALRALWPAFAVLLLALGAGGREYAWRMQAALPESRPHTLAGWWDQGWRQLPARRFDLTGRDKQFLNVQWAGDLIAVREGLLATGWEPLPPLSLGTGLRWLATDIPIAELPLMPRMHGGHYSVLNLRKPLDPERQYLLRLWPSGYRLDERTPLWLGSVTIQHAGEFFRLLRYPVSENRYTAALESLQPAPAGFEARDVQRSPGGFETRLLRPAPNRSR